MATYRLNILVEQDADGFVARCVELQGCFAQGDSYEEALENIHDVIRLHVEDRLERGEVITAASAVSLTTVDVTV